MDKSHHAITTSRRTLFTGAVAALALPAVSMLAAATGDDATLIDLGRQLEAAWAAQRAHDAKWAGQPFREEMEEETERIYGPGGDIADQIMEIPAKTLQGVRVKALAIWWCWCGETREWDTTDVNLAQSMVVDLLAMAGA